jgi:hypothetical protein
VKVVVDMGQLLEHVQVHDGSVGRVEWTVAVDSTINGAHQHAAGAHKRGPRKSEDAGSSKTRQALGRSRG